ncbi:hypothetical protein F5Y19DRAFT_480778 [Xylariaceae sp. FL1651]|nr:hypothetical protein F5Y19DRAFT_480778 [Xylariaceae sp. FL1651]
MSDRAGMKSGLDKYGNLCGHVFKRAWNLKRHVQKQHRLSNTRIGSTFINQRSPTPLIDKPSQTIYSRTTGNLRILQSDLISAAAPTTTRSDTSQQLPTIQHTLSAVPDVELPPGQLRLPPLIRNAYPYPGQVVRLPMLSTLLPSLATTPSSAGLKDPGISPGDPWLGKDHLLGRARLGKAMPGVKMSHSGTCITWPRQWEALEPKTLANQLKFKNCPLIDSDRSMYRYDDHITTTARAIAWFADWPRTGIHLDNFLELGPYQRNDGSHRCHNPLCVNPSHVVFEPTWYNLRRQECQKRAAFLRSQGRDVPSECRLHDPPCLMQRCAVQVFVFRQSYGLPQAPPGRPPWHRYPTFENQLPLRFAQDAAVRLRPCDQTTLPVASGVRRPDIVCQLCDRIKSFNRVAGLWSHIQKKHSNRSEEERIKEVRRTAALWESYLKTTRTNPTDPTMIKLADLARGNFSWKVVEGWAT